MKIFSWITVFLLCIVSTASYAQVLYSEGFETGLIPTGWSNEYVAFPPNVNWAYANGGVSAHPAAAHSGSFNARFYYASYSGETTKLVTKAYNIASANAPFVRFWHTQDAYGVDQDILKVYYKTSAGGSWNLLASFTTEAVAWTERIVSLPSPSSTYYIAFEGRTGYGYGVCIDDVTIEQTPPTPKSLSSVTVSQASTDYILSSTNNNPIVKLDFNVAGTAGVLPLQSISFNSLNTSDSYVKSNGVKLFVTSSDVFSPAVQLGSGASFAAGTVSFNSLNYDLPNGHSYVWACFDLKDTVPSGAAFDMSMLAGNINVNGLVYPASVESPVGQRVAISTIFQDNFETDKFWVLSGEFQRATPLGLGGSYLGTDPANAYSGTTLLGTDVTGLGTHAGDYEASLIDDAYKAISPTINCQYYTDVKLRFYRWLNVEVWDKVYISVSNDNGSTWHDVWQNTSSITDNSWQNFEYDLSTYVDKKAQVKIRFSLGTTDGTNHCSGWNIDDVILTGNFIDPEVSISDLISPSSGCGLGNMEPVTVKIKNFGGAPSNDTLRICYSVNGGSVVYDTLFTSIPVGDSINFTFNQKVDLSTTGEHEFMLATLAPADKNTTNDTLRETIVSSPYLTLPYCELFETNSGFWFGHGVNSSWQWGTPSSPVINSAVSGSKVWKTNLSSYYNNNEFSYLESPCFNFSGIANPAVEFKAFWNLEPDADGVAFEYSVNGGASWALLGQKNDLLNWYNHDDITALDSNTTFAEGWNYLSNTWKKVKHTLPPAIANQPNVKFRFVFASGYQNAEDGFAIDNFLLYNDVPDINISLVTEPSSACAHSSSESLVYVIKNNGSSILQTGDSVFVEISQNGLYIYTDTLILNNVLLPSQELTHTATHTFNLAANGTYVFDLTAFYSGDINAGNNTFSKTVQTWGHPNVSITNSDTTFCQNNGDVLLTANPGGGIFYGSGVSGGYFSPSAVSAGNYFVKYSYVDANTCSFIDSVQFSVFAVPVVTFTGLATEYCFATPSVELTGIPSGGSFSGNGISANYFSPSVVGVHNIIYAYTSPDGCTASQTQSVTVHSLPTVNFTGMEAMYCINGLNDTLAGSPAGGSFTGNGLVDGFIFSPSQAGAGLQTITYSYTDANFCNNSFSLSTQVHNNPVVTFNGLSSDYCKNSPADTLHGVPAGGVFTGSNMVDSVFNPLSPGIHNIVYEYVDVNSCIGSATQVTEVFDLPVVSITGLDSAYCLNSSNVTLTGVPPGGIFSGNGISGNTFAPSTISTGQHQISYSYTDINSCTAVADSVTEVLGVTMPAFNMSDTTFCQSSGLQSLSAIPSGGVFSGSGVVGDQFNPVTNGIFTIIYSYTNAGGCMATDTQQVVVLPAISVSFTGLNPQYCISDATSVLHANPTGGVFSGEGIVNDTIFNPALVTSNVVAISYSYLNASGCISSSVQNTNVHLLPVLSLSNISAQYCQFTSPDTIVAMPAGGTLSGLNVIGDVYNPLIAGADNIVYSFTDAYGCSNTITQATIVYPAPVVDFAGLEAAYCISAPADTLHASIEGGIYSGAGMVDSVFNPATAGVGIFSISYVFTDTNGCTASVSKQVEVYNLPSVNFTGLANAYCINDNVDTIIAIPTGGVFSGINVSGNVYNPQYAGVDTVKYFYSDANGCGSIAEQIVHVNSLPIVSFSGLAPQYCNNGAGSVLFGLPTGGVFSGNGILGNGFIPSWANTGVNLIQYTYTDSNLCTSVFVDTTYVNVPPTALFLMADTFFCSGNSSVILHGTPAGGVFIGNGVVDSVFTPYITGNYNVSYVYTDLNSCSDTASVQVLVNPTPTVTLHGISPDYCTSDGLFTAHGLPAGGNLLMNNLPCDSIQSPSVLGPGLYNFNYTFSLGGCTSSVNVSTAVHSNPIVSFSGLNVEYCFDTITQILTGTPSGGLFSGVGISGNFYTPNHTGQAQITYQYTDTNNCSASNSQNVLVHSLPTVGLQGLEPYYCNISSSDTLTGTPYGGYFSGSGMVDSIFYPSVAGWGIAYVTYTFTDTNSCTNHATVSANITQNPLAEIIGLASDYCLNTPICPLSGNPPGGVFSGPGLLNDVFSPELAGSGQKVISYVWGNNYGCYAVGYDTTYVHPLPEVSFTGLNESYCSNDSADVLTGNPPGGNFSGSAVIGNLFIPSDTVIGYSVVQYTYADIYMCANTSAQTVLVKPAPHPDFSGLEAEYCITSGSESLTGIPAGGWFTGNGISGSAFVPSDCTPGMQTINYFYTDTNGCIGKKERSVMVNNIPSITFPGIVELCLNSNPVAPEASPQGGAFFINNSQVTMLNPQALGAGTFNLVYLYTDSNACSNADTNIVLVHNLPQLNMLNLDTGYCANDSAVILQANPAGGVFSGSGVTDGIFKPYTLQQGNYYVQYAYTDNNSCTNTISKTVSIYPLPVYHFLQDTFKVTFPYELMVDTNFAAYQWSTGDTDWSTVIYDAGMYWVTVTSDLGCSATDSIYIDKQYGVEQYSGLLLFDVAPNPASNICFVSLKTLKPEPVEIFILGVDGSVYYQSKNSSFGELVRIPVSNFKPGMYFVKLVLGMHSFYKKLEIVR